MKIKESVYREMIKVFRDKDNHSKFNISEGSVSFFYNKINYKIFNRVLSVLYNEKLMSSHELTEEQTAKLFSIFDSEAYDIKRESYEEIEESSRLLQIKVNYS